jgi:NADH:ubiquinone oxidoreductase subunit K
MEALTNLSAMEWLAIEIAVSAIVLAIVFRWYRADQDLDRAPAGT